MPADLLPYQRSDLPTGTPAPGNPGTGNTANVVTLTLEQGDRPVVVLNDELLDRIDATLDAIEKEFGDELGGFVLASAAPRAFVAGADLKQIHGYSDEELEVYLAKGQRVFGRIAKLPCTTVAAIHAATMGGGLEIAMHCDKLVAVLPAEGEKPYPIGLPEAGLCICPGWGGTNLLPARIDPAEAIRRTATGKPFKVTEAHEFGLFDATVDNIDDLLPTAQRLAAEPKAHSDNEPLRHIGRPTWRNGVAAVLRNILAELPDTHAARGVAKAVEIGLTDGWNAAVDAERKLLIELRNTPEAQHAITTFLDRSKTAR